MVGCVLPFMIDEDVPMMLVSVLCGAFGYLVSKWVFRLAGKVLNGPKPRVASSCQAKLVEEELEELRAGLLKQSQGKSVQTSAIKECGPSPVMRMAVEKANMSKHLPEQADREWFATEILDEESLREQTDSSTAASEEQEPAEMTSAESTACDSETDGDSTCGDLQPLPEGGSIDEEMSDQKDDEDMEEMASQLLEEFLEKKEQDLDAEVTACQLLEEYLENVEKDLDLEETAGQLLEEFLVKVEKDLDEAETNNKKEPMSAATK